MEARHGSALIGKIITVLTDRGYVLNAEGSKPQQFMAEAGERGLNLKTMSAADEVDDPIVVYVANWRVA